MSYSIDKKVYTDHPLMDEIVHNCKIILSNIVVKNDVMADENETQQSFKDSDMFLMVKNGSVTLDLINLSLECLMEFGYDNHLASAILVNRDNIPTLDREYLLEFAKEYYLKHYEEKNDYYRMLMGLPEYGINDYNIYIDESYFPSDLDISSLDFSKPIHEFNIYYLNILISNGKLDYIINTHPGKHYAYLKHMGAKSIDVYKARMADKYDILYLPSVESLVQDRFVELYNQNKEITLKRFYTYAYAYKSVYYEEFMIIMLISQTFNDMIVDVPEWYIRRDIFDLRSVQYFLESFGVEYYKIIPLKYQIRIVKALNKLIKYKSSTKNIQDIMEIFGIDESFIFKYYLFKKRKLNGKGGYVGAVGSPDAYELEFIQTKLGDTYDNYIKDYLYRVPYDDITYEDAYWDGRDEHDYIRKLHLNKDFTIESTKYLSAEYKISMEEYLFQMEYFLGLLLDSNVNIDDIRIGLPTIQANVEFRISDLFIFLILMSYEYDNVGHKEIKPEDNTRNRTKKKPEFEKYAKHRIFDGGYSDTDEIEYDRWQSIDSKRCFVDGGYFALGADGGENVEYSEIKSIEDFYDWMKEYHKECFGDKRGRVFGFNMAVDVNELVNNISKRHSHFQFDNGFDLEDFGIEEFIVTDTINSLDDLITVYQTNRQCYKNLKDKIVNTVDNRDDFLIYNYVFEQLFTKNYDYNFYKLSNGERTDNLEDILKDRDYIIYNYLKKLKSEKNLETRRDNLRNVMDAVVNTLEYYLSGDGLNYIFNIATVSSFFSILTYIYLMLNFFKSYKVYFLDPYITYLLDDRMENSVRGVDCIAEFKTTYWKDDKAFATDSAIYRTEYEFDDHYNTDNIMEVVDIFSHFEPDIYDDYDYNGMYAGSEEQFDEFKDADGGLAYDTVSIPYITLNGGKSQGPDEHLWDLNGATAYEQMNYVDVDCGYSAHVEDYVENSYEKSAFKYQINAGTASTNQFYTKGIHTTIIDRQVKSKILISDKIYNSIEEKKDGLYVEDQWVHYDDFTEWRDDAMKTFDNFSNVYSITLGNLEVICDEEALDKRIANSIHKITNPIYKVYDYSINNSLEKKIRKYTDDEIDKLYDYFKDFSPLSWEDF